jgi:hypothetical protein
VQLGVDDPPFEEEGLNHNHSGSFSLGACWVAGEGEKGATLEFREEEGRVKEVWVDAITKGGGGLVVAVKDDWGSGEGSGERAIAVLPLGLLENGCTIRRDKI